MLLGWLLTCMVQEFCWAQMLLLKDILNKFAGKHIRLKFVSQDANVPHSQYLGLRHPGIFHVLFFFVLAFFPRMYPTYASHPSIYVLLTYLFTTFLCILSIFRARRTCLSVDMRARVAFDARADWCLCLGMLIAYTRIHLGLSELMRIDGYNQERDTVDYTDFISRALLRQNQLLTKVGSSSASGPLSVCLISAFSFCHIWHVYLKCFDVYTVQGNTQKMENLGSSSGRAASEFPTADGPQQHRPIS